MRAVIQRVTKGKVNIKNDCVGSINQGMVVLLAVGREDTPEDLDYMVRKVLGLRIFDDTDGKMNLSLQDIGGSMLVVSQLTLYGDCRKGKRPSWSEAASPNFANMMYELFVEEVKKTGVQVETGVFQAEMSVEIHNDGPVTILIDSKKQF